MADRLSQEAVEALLAGVGNARLSQEAIEALLAGQGNAVLSQEAIEVLIAHSTVTGAVSQVAVEVLVQNVKLDVLPFIASTTTVFAPTLQGVVEVPFIGSTTVVYAPTVTGASSEVDVPFIASKTRVFGVFSLFADTFATGIPGNGGEMFEVELAPNGVSHTATLTAGISDHATLLTLTGAGSFPTVHPFVVTIDDEVLYVLPIAAGTYRIRKRGMGNTTPAAHLAGADATWNDVYDLAISATEEIDASFTADITGTGSSTYPGWLICFDSSQAYLGSDRYPMHVTEVLGVFDAGAGSTGSNRCDAAQPNAVCVPAGVSDDCPAGLSNPSRIATDILPDDVAVVRYTNPEGSVLLLGERSVALQSWFGIMRVDALNNDVTLTDPTGTVVDGSIDGEWFDPLGPGVAPDTGLPTNHDVPYTSVTLPGADRTFTHGSPGFSDKGWPIGCVAVRQGQRRVPFWRSWDWHDFNYVYSGFDLDATFAQLVVNRNGIVFGTVPEVALPGPQDIDGPDAVWDDGDYHFGVAWYVAIYSAPYLVIGPGIGGGAANPAPSATGFVPVVTFPAGVVTVTVPPFVEGGSGGGINPPGRRTRFTAGVV